MTWIDVIKAPRASRCDVCGHQRISHPGGRVCRVHGCRCRTYVSGNVIDLQPSTGGDAA